MRNLFDYQIHFLFKHRFTIENKFIRIDIRILFSYLSTNVTKATDKLMVKENMQINVEVFCSVFKQKQKYDKSIESKSK